MEQERREDITIERLSYGKAGIGHTSEGKTIFVNDTVPGDRVVAIVDKTHPGYCEAHLGEIITASPHRVASVCPDDATCGGCSWQQVSYSLQLEAKRDNVIAALVHTAHFNKEHAQALVSDCIPSKRELGYRNKLELGASYSTDGEFLLGFRKEGTHLLSMPESCPLAHTAIQKAPKALRGALRYAQGTLNLGIFRVGVRHSLRTQDLEVALWTEPGAFPRKMVASTIASALKTTSVVRIIANPGKSRKIKQVESLIGKGYWEEELLGSTFKTSAPSFFQVNTAQAEVMIKTVLDGLQLDENAVVADLYAGGGTFSIPLAQCVDMVYAIESASSSVKDLRRNSETNDVGIEVIGGDSARELPQLGRLDALIVDPPKAGLASGVAESIAQANPKHCAYVSCNPSTWARDVQRLEAVGYSLTSVQPIDLFPQTYHTEIVSIFSRKDHL